MLFADLVTCGVTYAIAVTVAAFLILWALNEGEEHNCNKVDL
jgi:hypothetical protein